MRSQSLTGLAAAVVAVLVALLCGSGSASGADRCSAYSPSQLPDSARVERHTVGGVAVTVLLPPAYRGGEHRRYPVLYLLHPALSHEATWLAETDLAGYTAELPLEQQAIVVMPDGGSFGFYTDWADGSHAWETFHTGRLVEWTDGTYRTLAERRHRAVAGFSMGGFGAMHYAARHPGTFAAAAAFTGAVDLRAWGAGGPAAAALGVSQAGCDGRAPDLANLSPFGSPLDDDVYARHNPVDMAHRYRGTRVYLSMANGIPCPGDAVAAYGVAHLGEPAIAPMTERLHAALDRESIPHVLRRFECGLHVMPNAERGLEDFWPHMSAGWDAEAATPTPTSRRRPAQLRVRNARVRGHRLVVVAAVSRRASGRVRISFRSAGRRIAFRAAIGRRGRIRSSHRLPGRLAAERRGVVVVAYGGDADTRADLVKVRIGRAALPRRRGSRDPSRATRRPRESRRARRAP